MPIEAVETLIIGGGQAGLAMSHSLSQRGRPHLVLERHRIAERWRSERWDGLHFQFPSWSVALPGYPFPATDADSFPTAAEIVDYIAGFAAHIAAPIRCGVAVTALRPHAGGFVADTTGGQVMATNVVVATGPYQRPRIPAALADGIGGFQLHASQYRNPARLPPGGVLVIGSGASGSQIAEELQRAGRQVYFSIGRHRRVPRRYRGKDHMWWRTALGQLRAAPPARLTDRVPVLVTGAYGGHTIDFRQLAAAGMVLLGHAQEASGGVVRFADDLQASLQGGDAGHAAFLAMADAHVARRGLDLPAEPAAHLPTPDPPGLADPPRVLDLAASSIGAVIWATGYDVDFRWIEGLATDPSGVPLHRAGIAEHPGLYLIGLAYLSSQYSSLLSGAAEDAERLADAIADRMHPHS